VIEHHPHRTLAHFRRILVRCLACHRSTFSGVGASDKPGAVHPQGEGFFILGNIFYSTSNFRGRLELTSHIMDRLVADIALKAEWNAIKNKAGRLYQRRNTLAHGAAWSGDASDPEFMRYSVFSVQDQSMNYEQMCEATPSFFNYAERIRKLAIDVNAHLASRKCYPEDFPDQAGVD
jgi:hypothetical protein